MFGISSLVGSEGEDGLLMKAARDFTGESETNEVEPVREVAAPAAPAPAASEPPAEASFYDDADLIDSASGNKPSPNFGSSKTSTSESDEVMILPPSPARSSPARSSPSSAPAPAPAPGQAPAAGMRVGNGEPIVLGGGDE